MKCTLCDFETTSPFFKEAMLSQRLQVMVIPRNMNKFPGGPDHISTFEQSPHSLNKWDHSVYVCNCSPTSQNHKQRKLYYLWFLPGNWDKNNLVHNPFNLAQGLWHCDSHGSCTMEVRTCHGVVHELKEFMFLILKKRRHFKIHLPCARSV